MRYFIADETERKPPSEFVLFIRAANLQTILRKIRTANASVYYFNDTMNEWITIGRRTRLHRGGFLKFYSYHQVKVIDSQNDQYIAHLMDYFHICLESVRKLSVGKTKHLMLKALVDALGGYLRVYVLPITRHSYYGGNIKYRNAKMLFELFDELKVFLRTNGAGWSKPSRDVIVDVPIPHIEITPPKTSVACNGLIMHSSRKRAS